MADKVLSIEVGMHTTRLCMSDFKVKNPKVHAYAKFPTPPGSVVDGEIQVSEALVEALRNTISEHKMKCKQVIFSVASSKIPNREVVIPKVKPKQIATLVETNANEYFPIDLSQYQLGHVVLGTVGENETEKYKVLVLAFPLSLIESYNELAKAIGRQLVAIDYSGHSIYQMVKNECQEGVQMVVKIDEASSIVTILTEQTIMLQRTVAYGINDALETIMTNGVFNAPTYEEAVELSTRKTCVKLSIDAKEMVEVDGSEEEDDALLLAGKQAVANSLKMLINGIGRIMDYHASRNAGEQVAQIYITGMGAEFSGLSKLLTNELGIKTKGLVHLEGFNVEKAFKDGRFGEYIACMGAAVAPIGMVSEKKSKEKQAQGKDYTALAWTLLLVGVAVGGVLILTSTTELMSQQMRYNKNVIRMNELSDIQIIYNKYNQTVTANTEVEHIYQVTENHNEDLLAFISEMEEKMPSDIRVNTFSAALDSVTMNITVGSKEEMANVVQEVRNFDSIENVTISGAQENVDDNGIHTLSFTIDAVYKTMEQMRAEQKATEASMNN